MTITSSLSGLRKQRVHLKHHGTKTDLRLSQVPAMKYTIMSVLGAQMLLRPFLLVSLLQVIYDFMHNFCYNAGALNPKRLMYITLLEKELLSTMCSCLMKWSEDDSRDLFLWLIVDALVLH